MSEDTPMDEGLRLTPEQREAIAFLEESGLRFVVDFDADEAVCFAKCSRVATNQMLRRAGLSL